MLRTIDSEIGVSIDPPTPCSMRSAISDPVFGATEQSSEPTPNPARPIRNSRFRPSRSAVDPVSISSDGDDEQVGVGDPLQARQRGVQVNLQRRQRDVENC